MSTPPPSGILNSSVLYWDYACIAFFGVAYFLFMLTAIYYSVKGHERIAGVAKVSFFAIFFMLMAAIVDAFHDGFTFTRPDDGVTVQWMRRALETFILPLIMLAFFKVMHNPLWEESEEAKKRDSKIRNLHTVHSMSKMVVCITMFTSQVFLTFAYLCGNMPLRWFIWTMSLFVGLLALLFTAVYAQQYGTLKIHKNGRPEAQKGGFFGGKRKWWSIVVAWILLLLGFVTYYVINAVGSSTTYYLSYDYEATSYMCIQIVWIVALLLLAWAAKLLQYKEGAYGTIEQKEMVSQS
jgi:hypothetical protein